MSGLPDRAVIHRRSLLFNLLFIPGKNAVISAAPRTGIIFHAGCRVSHCSACSAGRHRAAPRADLWIRSTAGTRDRPGHPGLLNTLTASKSWAADLKRFHFMHAFHYKSWPEAFLDKPSNQTILHRLLKSNFVLCQHKQFNLMFSLLSKHWVSFKSPLQGRTPLCPSKAHSS